MMRGLGLLLATPLVVGSLTACGNSAAGGGGLKIAAGFYPLQYAAQRVAGDHADVENLTRPGAEPHDLELTIREAADVSQADLVVLERGLQPSVDQAADTNTDGVVLDVASVVKLHPFAPGDAMEEGGTLDPHFWQDPLLMADLGDAVAARLDGIDPANKANYDANAAALRADLEQLDHDFSQGLAHCTRHTIVVSHDAFGYLGRYGLELAPIAGLSPDAEPTAADLAHLQELIRAKGITTVFGERLVSPKLAQTLASDLGVSAKVLDPIEGLTDQTSGADYLSLMRSNLTALQEANDC